jgi:cellulose 1,4-beta-cellobiosidase
MDIWEANNAATAFTPHPCNITKVYACSGDLCGDKNSLDSVCDKEGCDFNSFRMGARSFYGNSSRFNVDTSKPFTVVTQFITSDNTARGDLTEIRRFYVQNGRNIPEARVSVQGIHQVNSMTDEYCALKKSILGGSTSPNPFKTQGGMRGMGDALRRGMVLSMSIWDDTGTGMAWLDSVFPADGNPDFPGVKRGPCPINGGKSAAIQARNPDAAVIFSNIRVGAFGTTT